MKNHVFVVMVIWCLILLPSDVVGAASDKSPSPKEWSIRMAESLLKRHPAPWTIDEGNPNRWEYTYGLMFKALLEVWKVTNNPKYFEYVEKYYDNYINENGQIKTYRLEEYNIDRINPGKPLFKLYEVTGKEKYRLAIELLRLQMRTHPRTRAGGFWHKQIYPSQMWLDGIYMASPFLAEYAYRFKEPELFDEVAQQVILMYRVALDSTTGLLYHGWDESRQQRWANPQTGCSPNFWGRALGWYSMAIVDVLDFLPVQHPRRLEIIRLWQQLAQAIRHVQDPQTGLWYQVLDKPQAAGNYLESSACCMFVYAFTKSVRLGYLDESYLKAARQGYQGILKQFITTDNQGLISITQACAVAGLGGNPYRDGSLEYYLSTPKSINDPKAMGPFILAGLELEKFNHR